MEAQRYFIYFSSDTPFWKSEPIDTTKSSPTSAVLRLPEVIRRLPSATHFVLYYRIQNSQGGFTGPWSARRVEFTENTTEVDNLPVNRDVQFRWTINTVYSSSPNSSILVYEPPQVTFATTTQMLTTKPPTPSSTPDGLRELYFTLLWVLKPGVLLVLAHAIKLDCLGMHSRCFLSCLCSIQCIISSSKKIHMPVISHHTWYRLQHASSFEMSCHSRPDPPL